MMCAPASIASCSEKLQRLSDGLAELDEQIRAMHQDVQTMIESMVRSERIANELLAELTQATKWLRQENERALCG